MSRGIMRLMPDFSVIPVPLSRRPISDCSQLNHVPTRTLRISARFAFHVCTSAPHSMYLSLIPNVNRPRQIQQTSLPSFRLLSRMSHTLPIENLPQGHGHGVVFQFPVTRTVPFPSYWFLDMENWVLLQIIVYYYSRDQNECPGFDVQMFSERASFSARWLI